MKSVQRAMAFAAMLLGGLGAIACVAAVLGIWLLAFRLNAAADRMFTRVDHALVAAQGAFTEAAQRVHGARIGLDETAQGLADWTKQEVRQRVLSRPAVVEKASRLEAMLRRADDGLASSESLIALVHEAQKLSAALGVEFDVGLADQILATVAALRQKVGQATEIAQRLQSPTEADSDDAREGRIAGAVQIATQIVLALTEIDDRLADMAQRLGATRDRAQQFATRTRRLAFILAGLLTLLALWMAAGQASLCYCGWKHSRRGQSTTST